MTKDILLAICGKSATGKDSLANWLKRDFSAQGIETELIVHDTTRPLRPGEKDGIDYNFLTPVELLDKYKANGYITFCKFNNWFYGIPKVAKTADSSINIVVVSPEELHQLTTAFSDEFVVIPILLEEKASTRLRRSRDREGHFKIEHFRRLLSDKRDFKNIKIFLEDNFTNYLILNNVDGCLRKTRDVKNFLTYKGFI